MHHGSVQSALIHCDDHNAFTTGHEDEVMPQLLVERELQLIRATQEQQMRMLRELQQSKGDILVL
jgi:hypothetical protein